MTGWLAREPLASFAFIESTFVIDCAITSNIGGGPGGDASAPANPPPREAA